MRNRNRLRFAAMIVLATLGMGAFPARATAAVFHVDSEAGSDKADGLTPRQAWRTLQRVNSATLKPGDAVLLRRGGTWKGTIAVNASGMPGAPITYGAYGTGPAPTLTGGRFGVAANGQDHVVVRELRITDTSGPGIHASKSNHWLIDRVRIERAGRAQDGKNAEWGGVQWWNGNDLTVSNSSFIDLNGEGVWVWQASDVRILNNDMRVGYGPHTDNAQLTHVRNFEIRGNTFSMEGPTDSGKGNLVIENSANGIVDGNVFKAGNFGLSIASDDTTIRKNQFSGHVKQKWSANILVGASFAISGNLIEGNVFRRSNIGVLIWNQEHARRNFVIRRNVFEDMDQAALRVDRTPISGSFTENEVRTRWAMPAAQFQGMVIRGENWVDRANVITRLPQNEHGSVR
jgi:polysaccharidase protein